MIIIDQFVYHVWFQGDNGGWAFVFKSHLLNGTLVNRYIF